MKPWARYLIAIVAGMGTGVAGAAYTVRSGALGSGVAIGPWRTGSDFGTAEASARTRAVISLSGLLALPAREARYYTAATDDAGAALDGRCTYRVSGGALPGRWWGLTLYDDAGYLVPNTAGVFSVQSAVLTPAERAEWTITVAPDRRPGHWLPTSGIERFDLTLRTYLPPGAGRGTPRHEELPRIAKLGCA